MARTAAPPGFALLATAIVALGPLTMSMYAPSMPAIADSLQTTACMVHVTLSVYLSGFALATLVYGPLSGRFGRLRVLQAGLVVYITGSVACALSQNIETLIAARVVQAAGACEGPAIRRAIVRDVCDREQEARLLALVGMALAVAPALGPVMGGYLQAWFDWHAVFVALTVAAALLLVLITVRLPETLAEPDRYALDARQLAATYMRIARDPTFAGSALAAAVALGGLFTFYAVGPFLLIDLLGVSPQLYGWLTVLTVSTYVLGGAAARHLTTRLGIERIVVAGSLVILAGAAALAVFALTGAVRVATIIGPMMAWTFGMGLCLPNAMAGAMSPFPRSAGAASALLGFLQMLVGALGSVLVAKLNDGTARPLGIILLLVALGGLAAYWHLVWRPCCRAGATVAASGE